VFGELFGNSKPLSEAPVLLALVSHEERVDILKYALEASARIVGLWRHLSMP
jgi:hypothetical protein